MGATLLTWFFLSLFILGTTLLIWRWRQRHQRITTGQPTTQMWLFLVTGTICVSFSLEQLLPGIITSLGIPLKDSMITVSWPFLTILIIATINSYAREYRKDTLTYYAQAFFLLSLALTVGITQPLGTLNSIITALYLLVLSLCCVTLQTDFIRGDSAGTYYFTALAEGIMGLVLLGVAILTALTMITPALIISPFIGIILLLHSVFLFFNARRMEQDLTIPPFEEELEVV